MSILIFILVLGILVLIHELGHFLVAKKKGVLVEEFGFGFPPRIFAKKIGETIYSINLIPFGGFVKLYGEEYHQVESDPYPLEQKQSRAFAFKHPQTKSLIIVAGVLMNFLLAIFLYYITLSLNNFKSEPMPLINDYNFRFGSQENRVVIGAVVKKSPASKTKIQIGDLTSRIGVKTKSGQIIWYPISKPEQFIELVKKSKDTPIYLDLENIINDEKKIVQVIPRYDPELKRAIIGINLVEATIIKYDTVLDRLFMGFLQSYNVTAYNLEGMRFLINQSAKEKSLQPVAEGSAGPLGIFRIIDETVQSSGKKLTLNTLNLLALLSLSLGFINILPFPALDGGRFALVVYEWLTKRRINQNLERNLNLIGFVILLTLAGLITINDIIKIYR
ncbi:hypothetical protein A3C98_01510 [Candidatus Roizmanbacteria bacterium RIFCSPHIGHO2_02_FULL_37_15]|uniref:Peptidase M50 domain-containing protein n=1 Tax=Candidatus Roizmanbacteria bacterium RIFCSPLOWO2_01_FULL_37_16 TaxID=1802058 RepID=A0A1F7IQJ8_9BACT|nr:MAG: hypothetical protein A2859_00415 [Candidatus Roizmanbacteria bacterium RIFCSPHIGHO2_01_FULL_37_16b]OGK21151.1 MAG: hypothetical protein A3C98_01510 [Candidatus Roizmanbacteria bacterium RIFCSPHIGHO2_02_FULL_37_15]OGK32741.1 MAG: hypothetical protein A3F57_02085 [Candidatus Roizmanbacteria bacterium RIFCSPHIGHO2_12_FULL_36_11]OGK45629.1 MAG: hypothetical protein A3B40_00350 [Candidatus Roizmanbacteria bacterium RIFCSPLOWO2_01_FULL_37_16]OGK56637.1 MAG: hypothetical protein A3I50_01195 [C